MKENRMDLWISYIGCYGSSKKIPIKIIFNNLISTFHTQLFTGINTLRNGIIAISRLV